MHAVKSEDPLQALSSSMSNLVDMWSSDPAAKLREKEAGPGQAVLSAAAASRAPSRPADEQQMAVGAAGSSAAGGTEAVATAAPVMCPVFSQTLRLKPRQPRASPCSDAAVSMMVDCFSP